MDGRCQCGLIKFTTPSSKPSELYICHCIDCRHQSSSSYGITAVFPHFKIEEPYEGAIAVWKRSGHSGITNCYFCTRCGSRLLGEPLDESGEPTSNVAVKGGCLDGLTKEMMREAFHIWTKTAIVDIPAGARQYEEMD